jgi:phosphatidylglycerol:prolipoprotein diacylglycerol transferase
MIHNLNPILFHIGPLPIKWYSLAYIAGITLGLCYIKLLANKSKLLLPKKFFDNLFSAVVIGIIVGGRLGHVLFYNPIEYLQNPIEIFKTWNGGMSFHGGLLGAIFGFAWAGKHYKINHWKLLDLAACASPIGIFFGRIANFINGELFGKATELPWGVIFYNTGGGLLARHPSQIYEALAEGLLLFLLLNLLFFKYRIYKNTRVLSGLFGIFYSLFRFAIEFFKEPDVESGYILGYFTMGQVLCSLMLIASIFTLSSAKKNK